ncbi:restriction endonuclease subunit S [Flavobacterium psychrophilum]|uniref:restriction endonuclease subunit S n=1 Tax=Flavobacterium psychrophilum TaxID=96345 RepID=UPI001152226C|nr:restriction endonuclease subunit S [Flavobacterium psychrophilum]GEJ30605.1 type II restriction enzyme [Flavobacterium psychrophilum]GEJ31986.1 type II restriction enzyme [Flavobacterium psychrophilum]GEJ34887.1 type II restriction enzyme [Flavobacterium psychrophilum]GEJ40920.1 type II restriction enzyme [Flavobacterium psychrophilum]GEJ41142.1 type II restriction enzyme [Flavobacterium psychrophilum]
MEWGDFYLGDLFENNNGDFDIQKKHINGKGEYVITAGVTNSGILGKSDVVAKIFDEKTITIDMFGAVFYRQYKYKMVTHARVFSLKPKFEITEKQGLFLSNSLHFMSKKFGYDNMCSWNKIKVEKIQLPIKKGKIDFEFMETFVAELSAQRVAELSAHLKVTGLNNYILTNEEQKVLEDFENGKIVFKEFTFTTIFNKILQGRRLKKEDQIIGNIPFVMAGTTNTGIAKYISNPVASFPKNSITIDIFGNTFYRNYDFGAGDDTGVYWHDERNYSEKTMLYLTSSMSKLVQGKFDFGNKLRSSQSLDFKVQLPAINNKPNYKLIETFITAIQKLVIKEVVLYADRKTEATKLATQN